MQLVGGTFGPEILNLLVSSEDVAVHLAKKFGVPDTLVRDKVDREQLIQAAQQMAAQQQQQQMMAPENVQQ